jgi:hypothetical protein
MYLEKGSLSYGEGDYVGFACDFKARAGIT